MSEESIWKRYWYRKLIWFGILGGLLLCLFLLLNPVTINEDGNQTTSYIVQGQDFRHVVQVVKKSGGGDYA